jgi:hypothetical protein
VPKLRSHSCINLVCRQNRGFDTPQGFEVVGVEHDPAPEPLDERLKRHAIDANLLAMADELIGSDEIGFDTFHSWQSEDED